MTGSENIRPGDRLKLTKWRKGLSSFGDERTIYGITDKSINTNGSETGWTALATFDWQDYDLIKCEVVPESVIRFQERQKVVDEQNKKHLVNAAIRIANMKTKQP